MVRCFSIRNGLQPAPAFQCDPTPDPAESSSKFLRLHNFLGTGPDRLENHDGFGVGRGVNAELRFDPIRQESAD
jgi:hypothetical protein